MYTYVALSPGPLSQLFNVARFLHATLKSWERGPGDEAISMYVHVCTKFEGVSKGALTYMYVCCRRGEGEGERVKEREREKKLNLHLISCP